MKNVNYFIQILIVTLLVSSCKTTQNKNAKPVAEKIENTDKIPSKYYGDFYAGVQTEATTTGMALISYYFTIDRKGAVLKTNTYHEPIRCNGNYKGKMNNDILELYYIGSEKYCADEFPNFKMKNESDKFFIQGLGSERTFNEWVEIEKK